MGLSLKRSQQRVRRLTPEVMGMLVFGTVMYYLEQGEYIPETGMCPARRFRTGTSDLTVCSLSASRSNPFTSHGGWLRPHLSGEMGRPD